MTVFFGLFVIAGALWLAAESAAKYGSPAPSMYYTSGNGWLLIIIGVIGMVCTRFFS